MLLTSLLSLLFLNGEFLKFFNSSGSEIYMNFRGIWESEASGNPHLISNLIPLTGIMILIIILSATAIFLFKKRKIQMKLAGTVIILTIIIIGLMLYLCFWISGKFQVELVPVYRMFIPVLILIFGVLAYLGIKRDENLVKSYERLR